MSIVANKVPSMRAALCDDAETARGTRLWNDANVLCLSLRRLFQAMALEIMETWFPTTYTPNPEDDACVADVNAIETIYAAASPSSGVVNEKGNSST